MPRLGNDKHEYYAQHRAKGMAPSKAALAAGFAAGSSTTHLENDPEITARIGEVTEENRQKREAQRAAAVEAAKIVGQMTGVGRSWVIQQLAEVAGLAKNDQDYAQANRALELIGKEFGMFNGGGDEAEGSAVPKVLNLDALTGVLDQAHGALPAPEADPDRTFAPDVALRLIEGQTKQPRVSEADRRLTTGSETDVALTEQWVRVDPATPAADLIAMANGAAPIVRSEPPTEAERDEFDALRARLAEGQDD